MTDLTIKELRSEWVEFASTFSGRGEARKYEEMFDRCLAQRDAEVQAQALREAADYQGPADEAAHFTPEARNLLRSLAERSAATPEGARFRRLQQAGTEGHRREE